MRQQQKRSTDFRDSDFPFPNGRLNKTRIAIPIGSMKENKPCIVCTCTRTGKITTIQPNIHWCADQSSEFSARKMVTEVNRNNGKNCSTYKQHSANSTTNVTIKYKHEAWNFCCTFQVIHFWVCKSIFRTIPRSLFTTDHLYLCQKHLCCWSDAFLTRK